MIIIIKKIKVVEVISDTNIGGAGRLLISRIKNSDKKKFNYTVVLPKGSLLSPLLKKADADIVEINACKDESFDFKNIFSFYKIIKKISPDILNSHACLTSRIAGRIAGVKTNLYTRHCDFPIKKIYSIGAVKNVINKFNVVFNDGVIAVSTSAKKEFFHSPEVPTE